MPDMITEKKIVKKILHCFFFRVVNDLEPNSLLV